MNRRQLMQSLAVAPLATALGSRLSSASQPATAAAVPAADRVIVISLDGVRTQEMFGGLDVAVARGDQWPRAVPSPLRTGRFGSFLKRP